jgi:nitrogen regulatory protein P-II 1
MCRAPREVAVKQIEAIVRPEKLEDVRAALVRLGHSGLTVTRVKGQGVQGGVRQMWRRHEYVVDLLPKVRLVAVVSDEDVDAVISTIVSAARTGKMGDGKIFVSPVSEAIRVRTGETGDAALLGEGAVHPLHEHVHLIDAEAS